MKKDRVVLILSVGAGLALLVLANAHLLYVAFASQPRCVQHIKQGEGNSGRGAYSAAQSGC